ncbi:MAG: hypothetical protein LBT05_14960, partial [Planctomycetaceae bacterium]|nr:hypothetical protein [Planctomycetaceae bacterium]
MARVYKKPLYRPVPNGAKIISDKQGKKYAYWIANNEEFTALYVDSKNGPRIVEESEFYIARYTDATGRFRERSTGCRDLRAAEHKLSVWLQEVEKVKAGILTQEEFDVGEKIRDEIEKRLSYFEEHLQAKSATAKYIREILSKIKKVCAACRFKRMCDLKTTSFVQWLNKQGATGMGARTRNGYREAMNTFCNWAVDNKSLGFNPFAKIPKVSESSDKRHERRALTDQEIVRLFHAAETRPLHEITVV